MSVGINRKAIIFVFLFIFTCTFLNPWEIRKRWHRQKTVRIFFLNFLLLSEPSLSALISFRKNVTLTHKSLNSVYLISYRTIFFIIGRYFLHHSSNTYVILYSRRHNRCVTFFHHFLSCTNAFLLPLMLTKSMLVCHGVT